MDFTAFGLIEPIQRALKTEGYATATPIQAGAIPPVMAGHDLLGLAQTGTGKTAAFALPVLQRLATTKPAKPGRPIRCLVLVPTRELATQVADSFKAYGRNLHVRTATIFGGVGQSPQVQALRAGVDVVVACPGRLLDLMGQGHVRFDSVEVLILDEADRMFDMGFLPDLKRIVATLPAKRQNLLFSATMPGEIRQLASSILRDPVEVKVAAVSSAAETVAQSVYLVPKELKASLLVHLLADPTAERTLVFSRTKHGADRLVKQLTAAGIGAAAIHGNKSQNARQRALEDFRSGKIKALVASDLAARGLDIDAISHVINVDLPHEPETYVHRIGRTGRAGATGTAISFCGGDERGLLTAIERTIRQRIPVQALPALKPLAAPIGGDRDDDDRPPFGGQRRSFGQRSGPPGRTGAIGHPQAGRTGSSGGFGRRSGPRGPRR
ncbi:DEAD/DEAH box family ATP-dependent RNA helicase [Planctomycetota bacterium]|nr:DEAD/DEAH box family ATP-dependent RNA helicase [Planctomycetota bacterium]